MISIPLNEEVGKVAVDTVLEKLVADGKLPESVPDWESLKWSEDV